MLTYEHKWANETWINRLTKGMSFDIPNPQNRTKQIHNVLRTLKITSFN